MVNTSWLTLTFVTKSEMNHPFSFSVFKWTTTTVFYKKYGGTIAFSNHSIIVDALTVVNVLYHICDESTFFFQRLQMNNNNLLPQEVWWHYAISNHSFNNQCWCFYSSERLWTCFIIQALALVFFVFNSPCAFTFFIPMFFLKWF